MTPPHDSAPAAPMPRIVRAAAGAGPAALAAGLAEAGLTSPRPVIVLVGGADGLATLESQWCARLFADVLVPFLERHAVALVDGGTDSGVMALAGRARHDARAHQPHIGVAATGTVQLPGAPSDPVAGKAACEPHHTHLVVVPGDNWGDEAPWISAVASTLAGTAPSVTVLANGGAISYDDVQLSLAAGRPVIVVAGTGRAADALCAIREEGSASGLAPGSSQPDRVEQLATSPLLKVATDAAALHRALARNLLP